MTLKLNDGERAAIETALDAAWLRLPAYCPKERADLIKALAIVREKPEGHRRVRSDFSTKGNKRQQPLPEIEPLQ